MKPVVIARTAAIAAVLVLAGIGCNAGEVQPPTDAAAVQPAAPTPRPASDTVAPSAPDTPLLPDSQSLKDRVAAMESIMLGESPAAEATPEPAPELVKDSTPAPDSPELEGGAISAAPTSVVPTRGVVDAQGNLPQPELGDALIDFTLPRAGGGEITLSEIGRDRYTVLVFYRAFW